MKIHFVDSHSYGLFSSLWNGLFSLLALFVHLFLTAFLIHVLDEAASGQLEDPNVILVTLFGILVTGTVFIGLVNLAPSIRVYEEGLKVRIFMFWWAFVPWDDILDLVVRYNPMGRSRVVLVRKLTPAHLLIGLIYTFRLKPGFLILSSIDRYHDLIRTIKSRTGLEG